MIKDTFEIECAIRDCVFVEDWENVTIKNFIIKPTYVLYIHENGSVSLDNDAFNQMEAVELGLLDDEGSEHICEVVLETTGADVIKELMYDPHCDSIADGQELMQYIYALLT